MRIWSPLSFSATLMVLSLGGANPSWAQAAGPSKVDSALAAWGKQVWNHKQCFGCHQMGKSQSTGPDLIGVTDRRTPDWIRKWLTDPVGMTSEDSIAMALKKQYKTQMPNLGLTGRDIDGLINYLAQETQAHTK